MSMSRSHTRNASYLLVFALFVLAARESHAGNWPGWRGPTGAGYSDENDLPLTWGGKKDENVLWKVDLKGKSFSSPIVWGDRVFITNAPRQSDKDVKDKIVPEHWVICYGAADGKERWRTTVPPGKFADGYYTIPTPVTDGERVYAWFGSGVMAALDFEGKIVWRREQPGPYHVYPGISSSPLLYKDTVVILCDQGKDSFLLALDKKSGEVKWEKKRPKVSGSTNSSPILMPVKGKPQIMVAASKALQGLDPATGDVLWWCAKDGGYWTSLTYGSGLVYADSGSGRGLAVDPSGTGDIKESHVKWQHPKVPEGLGCPIIVGDYLYRVHKPGILKCWKLSSGDLVYDKRLENISFLSSPIATPDGRIYIASPRRTYVIQAGPEPKVLATNDIKDSGDNGPSPAVSGGRIFLKTTERLYCVGKK
ncbi:MAG TPA: PQQ-binding-like beta-propeller repeat protein [Gemmataceae bacterium]|nr:PQQ-binding-like beta-propeller repeat protein [Gemmataceae bacterium]